MTYFVNENGPELTLIGVFSSEEKAWAFANSVDTCVKSRCQIHKVNLDEGIGEYP
jgi:hypothetical protein